MVKDFSKWGVKSLGENLFCPKENHECASILGASLADGSENVSTRKQKNPKVKLKKKKDRYPILLSLKKIDHHGLLYKKQLIGKFVSDIYGL
jgi:hypothetical protein